MMTIFMQSRPKTYNHSVSLMLYRIVFTVKAGHFYPSMPSACINWALLSLMKSLNVFETAASAFSHILTSHLIKFSAVKPLLSYINQQLLQYFDSTLTEIEYSPSEPSVSRKRDRAKSAILQSKSSLTKIFLAAKS